MKKIIFMSIFALLTTFGVVFLFPNTIGFLSAANSIKSELNGNVAYPTKIRKIVKKQGWDLTKKVKEFIDYNSLQEENKDLDNLKVKIKKFTVKNNQYFSLENFVLTSENELDIAQNECVIEKVFFYEVNEKIFAYRFDYVPIDPNSKRKSAALISYHFIDNDGDGIFEELSISPKLGSVPNWIKN